MLVIQNLTVEQCLKKIEGRKYNLIRQLRSKYWRKFNKQARGIDWGQEIAGDVKLNCLYNYIFNNYLSTKLGWIKIDRN
jgi:hypothetical protein